MKKKHFYHHLVNVESVHIELTSLDISEDEKKHLGELAESNIHHSVLDVVLSELSHEDKKVFLRQVHLDDHHAIWRFLNKKTKNFEELIAKTGEDLLKKLHKDIKDAKRK